jgi:NAD(P)-dependent dehydrogenase (short-subunit alcohol dehydrogenase family)
MSERSDSNYMAGKICLVTGATAGIGKITATALAALGTEVVIAGRNRQKAEATVREIVAATGNDKIGYLLADFADFGQVRELATSFKERYTRLDLLVNNAGAFVNTRKVTEYGVEKTFLVNHLSPFLLTNLLLKTIQDSAPARIVNIASDAHRYDKMDFDDLGFKRGYSGMKGYSRSKLANVLFTNELARRLEGSGVSANAVHPGHVATDIWKTNFGFVGPLLKWIMGLFALTPEQGAETPIYVASSPELEGVTGKYFDKREPVPSSPISYDEDVAQRLWKISENLTSVA